MPTRIVDGVSERWCGACKEWKLLDARHFHRNATDALGFQQRCKPCMCDAARSQANRNRERRRRPEPDPALQVAIEQAEESMREQDVPLLSAEELDGLVERAEQIVRTVCCPGAVLQAITDSWQTAFHRFRGADFERCR